MMPGWIRRIRSNLKIPRYGDTVTVFHNRSNNPECTGKLVTYTQDTIEVEVRVIKKFDAKKVHLVKR